MSTNQDIYTCKYHKNTSIIGVAGIEKIVFFYHPYNGSIAFP